MSTIPEFEALTRSGADDLLDAHGIERSTDNPLADFAGEFGDQPSQWALQPGLIALVREAVIIDRRQRGLVEAVAEVLDDRDAEQAAQLVRDTDPDDDLWKNYFGPMLDELEDDYTRSARDISQG